MEPFSVVAPTSSADGYGYSAEALILAAVREYDADIAFIEHDWRDSRYTDPDLLALQVNDHPFNYRSVLVVYFLPFALTRFRSLCNIGMSMWETDRLPDSWAIVGRLADAYIVPSEHSKKVFAERLNCPIEVVPFGTDTDLHTIPHRRYQDRTNECVFLMSGLLHYRKGVEFALRAFREEFCHGEQVSLTLKTRRGFLDAGSEVHTLADERITVIDEDWTRDQMVALYHSHDCLLAPSRGEGSGLTPRDAMSTGLPVILTDWSGLSEIADSRYTYPVEVEELEPAPLDCSSYAHGITGGGPIGNFARPSISQLRDAMRSVYEDRSGARLRGLAAADWMRRQWTWEHCAWQWLRALETLTNKFVETAV